MADICSGNLLNRIKFLAEKKIIDVERDPSIKPANGQTITLTISKSGNQSATFTMYFEVDKNKKSGYGHSKLKDYHYENLLERYLTFYKTGDINAFNYWDPYF